MNPYPPNSSHASAWEKGRAARTEGQGRETCPYGDYPRRSFKKAWVKGYEAPLTVHRDPVVHVQSVPIHERAELYGTPLDTFTPCRAPVACAKCSRLYLESMDHATVCTGANVDRTRYYFRCRVCEWRWSLDVA